MRVLIGLAATSSIFFAAAPILSIQPVSAAPIQCPDTWTGNKCEYYRDGYKAGVRDRKAGLSNAYERHAGAYDTANASYFQAGHETGWDGK